MLLRHPGSLGVRRMSSWTFTHFQSCPLEHTDLGRGSFNETGASERAKLNPDTSSGQKSIRWPALCQSFNLDEKK